MIRILIAVIGFLLFPVAHASQLSGGAGIVYGAGVNNFGSTYARACYENHILPDCVFVGAGFSTVHYDGIYRQYDERLLVGMGKYFSLDSDARLSVELAFSRRGHELSRDSSGIDLRTSNDGVVLSLGYEQGFSGYGFFALRGGLDAGTGNPQISVNPGLYSGTDFEQQKSLFLLVELGITNFHGMDFATYAHITTPDSDLCETTETHNVFGVRASFLRFISVGVEQIQGACENKDYRFVIGASYSIDDPLNFGGQSWSGFFRL